MEIVGGERRLVGRVEYACEFEEALRLAASGRVDLKPLTSRVAAPAELQQALGFPLAHSNNELKVLVGSRDQ